MKTIKMLIPTAMTFAMFMSYNTMTAQSAYNDLSNNFLLRIAKEVVPKKPSGLEYTKTLIQINNALITGVKADYTIDFQGKMVVTIELDQEGTVQDISFDKPIAEELRNSIVDSLENANLSPVRLNGKAKAQTFKIPVLIK